METPVPKTHQSDVHKSPLDLMAEENARLRDELRRSRVAVAPAAPWSQRAGLNTKPVQWGALAGAIAIVVTAVSPIIGSWLDVQRLRAGTESRFERVRFWRRRA